MKRLTKEQYETITTELRVQRLASNFKNIARSKKSYLKGIDLVARGLAQEFAESDPDFNREKFLAQAHVCNIVEGLPQSGRYKQWSCKTHGYAMTGIDMLKPSECPNSGI